MNIIDMAWQGFFGLQVGAHATLTGLVFVSISINLARILSIAHLPSRAGEALLGLVGGMVVSSLATLPRQPLTLFAFEALVIGLIVIAATTAFILRSYGVLPDHLRAKTFIRLIMDSGAGVAFVVGGIAMLANLEGGLYWIGGGLIVSLVAGVWNCWILLVEIVR